MIRRWLRLGIGRRTATDISGVNGGGRLLWGGDDERRISGSSHGRFHRPMKPGRASRDSLRLGSWSDSGSG